MGVNRFTGSPWHKERVHRAEGDDRRYKGRCKYYQYEEEQCTYKLGKCTGSAHCNKYTSITDDEFRNKQKSEKLFLRKNGKKVTNEETYWYD